MALHKLKLEDLQIESFDTTSGDALQGGTVHAHSDEMNSCLAFCSDAAGCSGGCSGQLTCDPQTCAGECPGTGNDITYPPHNTCDQYQDTCVDGCMW